MIKTGVPYKNTVNGKIVTVTSEREGKVFCRWWHDLSENVYDLEFFKEAFQEVRESAPPKGWDEEL